MTGFVKLDCGILQSSLYPQRDLRDIFITALLMAKPHELVDPAPQLEVRSLAETGWTVPAGWYGFVAAAGIGIINAAGVEREAGLVALEQLGAPEADSRSRAFDGRRLVRVDGGFLVLNFMCYRDKDHTAADRARRYRERHAVTSRANAVTTRNVTHAEIRDQKQTSEADLDPPVSPPVGDNQTASAASKPRKARKQKPSATSRPENWQPTKANQEYAATHGLDGEHEATAFCAHHDSKGNLFVDWDAAYRTWLANQVRWNQQRGAGGAQGTANNEPKPSAEEIEQRHKSAADAEAFARELFAQERRKWAAE
jgi:hypothetical protein